jgi:hypothetical protein
VYKLKISLDKFANGELLAKFTKDYEKTISNIYDPNTSPKAKRQITITIDFSPTEDRSLAEVNVQSKSKLAPTTATKSRILIERDFNTGEIVSAELKAQIAGQVEMDIPEEAPKGDNVVELKDLKSVGK